MAKKSKKRRTKGSKESKSEEVLEIYDEEPINDNVYHNDIDSEIEDLRRRVLEEEEDAKFVDDDSQQSKASKSAKASKKFGMGAALFELIPGLLLGTLGLGHFHNHRIVKGFLTMIFYWLILIVEGYIMFNLFGNVDVNDLAVLGVLFVIIDLYIILVSTHSAFHGTE